MSSHFELDPAEYERRREGHMQRRRRGLVAEILATHAPPDGTAVELGCGPGGLVASLAESWAATQFVGLDVDERMIEHARQAHVAPNLRFDTADLAADAPDLQADVAFSVDLVHHVHALDRFLANVRRLLRTGGVWLVIEPNVFHPYVFVLQERMRRRGLDEDHFRPWVFERGLRAADLEVVSRRTAFVFPGWVDRVPPPLERVERAVERFPLVGGSRVYVLRAV